MADFDALIKQAEEDQQAIVKPAMPEVKGTRRPILIFVGESKAPLMGHIIESPHLVKIVHDIKVLSYTVTHVARLLPAGVDSFTIKSDFVHVKQNPAYAVAFYGTLTKEACGYSGAVTISRPGFESTQSWSIEYDD